MASSSPLASPATRARNERVHVLFTDNPESRPVLCYLVAFLALADVPAVEISSRLFGGGGGGGEPSVVGKMVLDAIKATKVEGLARRPGEALEAAETALAGVLHKRAHQLERLERAALAPGAGFGSSFCSCALASPSLQRIPACPARLCLGPRRRTRTRRTHAPQPKIREWL